MFSSTQVLCSLVKVENYTKAQYLNLLVIFHKLKTNQ